MTGQKPAETDELFAQRQDEMPAMVLPVRDRQLLLPSVSVVEIIRFSSLQAESSGPAWFIGFLSWRGLQVPMVSFEALNEDPFLAPMEEQCAAIINAPGGGQAMPFYGMVLHGTPRMMRVPASEIVSAEGAVSGPAETVVVNVCGEQAAIPDLAWLEGNVLLAIKKLAAA